MKREKVYRAFIEPDPMVPTWQPGHFQAAPLWQPVGRSGLTVLSNDRFYEGVCHRAGITAIADWCRRHRHDPVEAQQRMLNAKLRGHYQYYGRPTNYRRLWQFFRAVRSIWRKWLARRTRGTRLPWETFAKLLNRHPLLLPRITHAWMAR